MIGNTALTAGPFLNAERKSKWGFFSRIKKQGVRLWLFGIFPSGRRADDMVNGFREMHLRFSTHELAYVAQNQKIT